MTEVKQYQRIPNNVAAIQLYEHTFAKAALWCGGVVSREMDRGVDAYTELIVPNIDGNQKAHVGDYVVRKEDGRFFVDKQSDFEGEFQEVGKRDTTPPGLTSKGPLTPHYVARGQHPFGN